MSKQSNGFQHIIYLIHQQLAGTHSNVSESAYLFEKGTNHKIKREVDVLIEFQLAGKTHKIAIECRDRAQKDDIIWVDSLIGKFHKLDVDEIIAVSSSGFTRAAKIKAKAADIELKTLEEAAQLDWLDSFKKLGALKFQVKYILTGVSARLPDESYIEIKFNDGVIYLAQMGTFSEILAAIFDTNWHNITKQLSEKVRLLYKNKSDLRKTAFIQYKIEVPPIQLQVNGLFFTTTTINLSIAGISATQELQVRHFKYDNSLISKTNVTMESNKFYTLFLGQTRDSEEIVISIDKPKFPK